MKHLITSFVLLAALLANAHTYYNKADVRSRPHNSSARAHARTSDGQVLYTSLLVELNDNRGIAELEADGAVILHRRGNIVLVCMPRDKVKDTGRSQFVDRYSVSQRSSANVDRARTYSRVERAHRPADTDAWPALDGSGVVTGICDMGFDPEHIAFEGRLGLVSHFVDSTATDYVWAPGTSLHNGYNLQTDTPEHWHATHVANILAGGWRGNPYYGYAPGATLAVTTSQLTDVGLLCGIENIIAYARERGMPAVVNLSVGSYLGPHDGTDLVNRYLDMLGQEATIFFSAGNNGLGRYSLCHTLGADSPGLVDGLPSIGTMLESAQTWTGHSVEGALDVWSDDSTTFEMQFAVWDQTLRRWAWLGPWIGGATGIDEWLLHKGDASAPDSLFHSLDISLRCGTDAGNGRYMVAMDYAYDPVMDLPVTGHKWARHVCGWRIRGAHGTRVHVFTDGVTSWLRYYGAEGCVDGDSDFTVSNLCANRNTICVGSYASRNTAPDGAPMGFNTDCVSPWSSYGTLPDGRRLPHFCAPGQTLVSAISSCYMDAHPEAVAQITHTVNGRTWHWNTEQGTSMASPGAAGAAALWLQACPALSPEQIRSIAVATAHTNWSDFSNPRWGAGALDVTAGLAEVVRLASVGSTPVLPPHIYADGRRIYARLADGAVIVPAVYSLTGARMDASQPLPAGVYIAETSDVRVKIAVR